MKKISFLFILLIFTSVFAQDERDLNSLMSRNAIGVSIGGNFIVTGTFPSFLNERVDQFVTRIYNQTVQNRLTGITDPSLQLLLQKELENYTLRDITLKRVNGTELKIDLLKFRRTGDYAHNPYLAHDDVVLFPAMDLERNFITTAGAVMKPGKYHFVEGDRLGDALEISSGVNRAYENISVIIYRQNYDGSTTEIIKTTADEDFPLERGDRILLTADEPQKRDHSVFVFGEVNRPGTIPVSKSSTTLWEVIERAGGIKETASLKNARLYTGNSASYILEKIYGINTNNRDYYNLAQMRLNEEIVDIERMMMYRLSGITTEDSAYFTVENHLRVLTESGSFDFTNIQEKASASASYIVRDGDIIIIPEKQNTVYMFGSIVKPGHIEYVPGEPASYYINRAGGLGEYAQDDVMLIKSGTRNWIPIEDNPEIEPGDYIFVPRDEPRTFGYYVELTSRYLSIVGSLATIVLLLYQFSSSN
jgi:protein involved in polysaccharide export with SLBB domain